MVDTNSAWLEKKTKYPLTKFRDLNRLMSARKRLVETDADADEVAVDEDVKRWPESDPSSGPSLHSIVILQTEGAHVDIGRRWPCNAGRRPICPDHLFPGQIKCCMCFINCKIDTVV